MRIGIVGASGYAGAELVRLLDGHPELEVAVLAAHSQAGQPVAALYPHLAGTRVFETIDPDQLATLDLVFLATPHGPSLTLAAALVAAGVRTVDLSGAFRLVAGDFSSWYGEQHPFPALAQDGASPAVYGLTEYARKEVADALLVANPGCYVTTALLGLLPLAGLIAADGIVVDGKSGTSGAGRTTSDALHVSHASGGTTAYGAPRHRHTVEIEHHLRAQGGVEVAPITFTPHLLPVARGMLTTTYATLRPGVTPAQVQSALVDRYADEPFVHVLAAGTFPHTKSVVGSNGCQLAAVVDDRTNRVVVTSVTDNLGKGAAGQALQNANVMLGLPETLGLTAIGMYP